MLLLQRQLRLAVKCYGKSYRAELLANVMPVKTQFPLRSRNISRSLPTRNALRARRVTMGWPEEALCSVQLREPVCYLTHRSRRRPWRQGAANDRTRYRRDCQQRRAPSHKQRGNAAATAKSQSHLRCLLRTLLKRLTTLVFVYPGEGSMRHIVRCSLWLPQWPVALQASLRHPRRPIPVIPFVSWCRSVLEALPTSWPA